MLLGLTEVLSEVMNNHFRDLTKPPYPYSAVKKSVSKFGKERTGTGNGLSVCVLGYRRMRTPVNSELAVVVTVNRQVNVLPFS